MQLPPFKPGLCWMFQVQYIFWKILRPAYHISPQYLLVMLHNKSNLTHSPLINNQILKIAKNTTGREERGEYFTLNWRSSIESGLLKVF